MKRIINDDRGQIEIYEKMYHFNPSPISPHNEQKNSPYKLIKSSYFHVYNCDDIVVAPGFSNARLTLVILNKVHKIRKRT